MLGNFSYYNPTKLYFGDDALEGLRHELSHYGKNVLLVYGGGSIKQNGIYDQVTDVLKACGKTVREVAGVMPNPTYPKLLEGITAARESDADLILACGGGSCCDFSKAVAVAVDCPDDPWEKFYVKQEEPSPKQRVIPVGCVLTMAGTGSEMNAGSVITNPEKKLKIGKVFSDARVFPKFSVLNPKFTFSLPKRQMTAGIYDTFNHICEQYFSGYDDNTSDYIAEGLMRSVITSSKIAVEHPDNYEARSNLMWIATWALNTFIAKGKTTDWMVHMLGQAVGAYTNATHGMTLSAVSLAYYRFLMPYGLFKFKRFAVNVWGVEPDGKNDETVAKEGLERMEVWMRNLGVAMNLSELGVTKEMIPGIADATFILKGGYKVLTRKEVIEILKKSL
jgi:alcohol dehydrogenase YqhD (iron-dependent ADH family)